MNIIVQGILLGLAIAAPVGPIGLLCIRRTLTIGPRAGISAGLGAATADALYGSVAAFGLATVSNVLVSEQRLIRLVGGLFLAYLAWRTFQAPPSAVTAPDRRGLAAGYVSTLLLTLTNPLTILSFGAIFSSLARDPAKSEPAASGLLVIGVFTGSVLWWCCLCLAMGLMRGKCGPRQLQWVNRIAGLMLGGFAVTALVSGFSS